MATFDANAPDTQHALRLIAEEAARAGGQTAQRYFRSVSGIRLKKDHSEVSEADDAAQAAVIDVIRKHRPDDAFIAEETLALAPPAPAPAGDCLCWVIDPLDGTRNFIRQLPAYTCSVAVMFAGHPLAGAIYDPQQDTMYAAGRDVGLFLNGTQQVAGTAARPRPEGLNPRPLVGLPSTPAGPAARLAHAWVDRFVSRSLGSTALHLALVATGALDGMLADNAKLWDIAAGCVLVTAAGGQVSRPDGTPLFPIDVAAYQGTDLPTIAATATAYTHLMSV
jgi:myo-inositol-1(or 4)-monophosphatase